MKEEMKIQGIGNEKLKIVWNEHLGEYKSRVGGGIFYKDKEWRKIADMAEGNAVIYLPGKNQYLSVNPTGCSVKEGNGWKKIILELPVLKMGEIEWKIEEEWAVRDGDNKLGWLFKFTPSGEVKEKCYVGTNFNIFPDIWRLNALPSCCGYSGKICYAVYPEVSRPWWMRLEGPKIIANVHYPFTYKPSRKAKGPEPVALQGFFLTDELMPAELSKFLRDYFQPRPHRSRNAYKEVISACMTMLNRSYAAAREEYPFTGDEGAFIDLRNKKEWMHHRNKSTFGAGFSCGYSGDAIIPLIEHFKRSGDRDAVNMAQGITNWIVNNLQVDYGGYYLIYDMGAKEGMDFIGEDYTYPCHIAKMTINILSAYEYFKNASYKGSGLKACDWLLSLQEKDGGIPWKVIASTGGQDGTKAYAASSGWIIACWVKAYEITGKEKYLRASERLAEWLKEDFIRNYHYAGYITDDKPSDGFDRWETPSSPAASCVIEGLCALHRASRKKKYLQWAIQAGYFSALWQWLWEPADGLGVRIKGTTQASGGMQYTIDQTLGTELPNVLDGYLNLYELTGDEFWLNAAKMGISRMEDDIVMDKNDPRYGGIKEGWNLNEDAEISGFKDDPHINVSGVAYFINNIERMVTLKEGRPVRPAEIR